MNAEKLASAVSLTWSLRYALSAVLVSLAYLLASQLYSGQTGPSLAYARETYLGMKAPVAAIVAAKNASKGPASPAADPGDIAGFWQKIAVSARLRPEQMVGVSQRDPMPVNEYYATQVVEVRLSGVTIQQLVEFMASAEKEWPNVLFSELVAEPSEASLDSWNVRLCVSYFVTR